MVGRLRHGSSVRADGNEKRKKRIKALVTAPDLEELRATKEISIHFYFPDENSSLTLEFSKETGIEGKRDSGIRIEQDWEEVKMFLTSDLKVTFKDVAAAGEDDNEKNTVTFTLVSPKERPALSPKDCFGFEFNFDEVGEHSGLAN